MDPHLRPNHPERSTLWHKLGDSIQRLRFDASIGNLGTDLGIANANSAGPGLAVAWLRRRSCAPQPNSGTTLTNIGSHVVQQDFADTVIQFNDGVTVTHGKHVFKGGFQMWRYRVNTGYTGNTGQYGDILFGAANALASISSAIRAADFFLGYPEARGIGVERRFCLAPVLLAVWRIRAGRLAHYAEFDPEPGTAL